MEKFYITTAIDYANSTPHVGTAYEKIGADVIARFKRRAGYQVYFLMGNDEHSQNVRKKALEQNLDPLEYCHQMAKEFMATWKELHISHDDFIQTSEKRHEEMVKEIASRIYNARDGKDQPIIYKAPYEGHYCVSCETFYQEKDLVDGLCPNHKTKPEWIQEENYFFRLSSFSQALRKFIEENPQWIQPLTRRNEILGVLDQGLEDVSISRSGGSWGVKLPFDETVVAYVWFDALINYVSALGPIGGEKHCTYWPADLHVVGKDITRFHCLIWPAMLMAAKLPPAKAVWAHGFVSIKGEKMSKSRGNVADPRAFAKDYGADILRFHLMREVPWDKDGDFSEERLVSRYNSDLANDLGNLVSRAISMAKKYFGIHLQRPAKLELTSEYEQMSQVIKDYKICMEKYFICEAIQEVWKLVTRANHFIDEKKPWILAKDPDQKNHLQEVLYVVLEDLRWIAILLGPIMPEKMQELLNALGVEWKEICTFENFAQPSTQASYTFDLQGPLFPRIEHTEEQA